MKTDAEVEALVRAFEGRTLPRAAWTHGAHLIVALWYLRRHTRVEATGRLREGIRGYNLSRGNPAGYHETVTLAWVSVVSRFLAEHDHGQPFPDLAGVLLGECGDSDYLRRFYSGDLLRSDEARRSWVPPDLQPIEVAGTADRPPKLTPPRTPWEGALAVHKPPVLPRVVLESPPNNADPRAPSWRELG